MGRNLLLGVLCVVLIAGQIAVGNAPPSLLGEALHDSAHIPWFALIALLISILCHRIWPDGAFVRLVPVLVLLMVATELLQFQVAGRIVSLGDVYRNGVGALLGTVVYTLSQRNARFAVAGAVALGVVLTLWEPVQVLRAKATRQSAFPVLFNADIDRGMRLLRGNVPYGYVDTEYGRALAVPVLEQDWPGVRLRELHQDWRRFDTLVVDLVLDHPRAIRLIAGTRHLSEGRGGASRSIAQWVAPGKARLRFPRAWLSPGRNGGHTVAELMLYSDADDSGARWLLLRAYLE